MGIVVGVALVKSETLKITDDVPPADFASLVLSIVALLLVPSLLSRIERRDSFDRRAIAERLEPARDSLYDIEDSLEGLTSDSLSPTDREILIRAFKKLRKNIERSKQIALESDSKKWLVDDIDSCAALAGNLNRVATGATPYSRRNDAKEISEALRSEMQRLLRELA